MMLTENLAFLEELREGVRAVCKRFDDEYWRNLDEIDGYPTEFVEAITQAGFLGALIPEQYGGSGLGILEASVILEEINRSGGNAGACHAQMYTMGTIFTAWFSGTKGKIFTEDCGRIASFTSIWGDRA